MQHSGSFHLCLICSLEQDAVLGLTVVQLKLQGFPVRLRLPSLWVMLSATSSVVVTAVSSSCLGGTSMCLGGRRQRAGPFFRPMGFSA